jgi:hypothetical protein
VVVSCAAGSRSDFWGRCFLHEILIKFAGKIIFIKRFVLQLHINFLGFANLIVKLKESSTCQNARTLKK